MAPVPQTCSTYPISAVAARFGVSLRTLRFYEERGLLQPIQRAGRRHYSSRDVVRLQVILLAKRFGFTIHEIWELLERRMPPTGDLECPCDLWLGRNEIAAKIEGLEQRRREIDDAIRELSEVAALAIKLPEPPCSASAEDEAQPATA